MGQKSEIIYGYSFCLDVQKPTCFQDFRKYSSILQNV